MIKASDFSVVSAHTALFDLDPNEFSQPHLMGTILSKYADRFDGSVESQVLPEDAPVEIIRVELSSEDQDWNLTARPDRIDVKWNFRDGEDSSGKVLECAEVLLHYIRSTQPPLQIKRLGLVIALACASADPAQELVERFCNENVHNTLFIDSLDFQIHNHKKCQLEAIPIDVNCWVKCKSGMHVKTKNKVILVEQDINTAKNIDDERELDADFVQEFYKQAELKASQVLQQYFPEE